MDFFQSIPQDFHPVRSEDHHTEPQQQVIQQMSPCLCLLDHLYQSQIQFRSYSEHYGSFPLSPQGSYLVSRKIQVYATISQRVTFLTTSLMLFVCSSLNDLLAEKWPESVSFSILMLFYASRIHLLCRQKLCLRLCFPSLTLHELSVQTLSCCLEHWQPTQSSFQSLFSPPHRVLHLS